MLRGILSQFRRQTRACLSQVYMTILIFVLLIFAIGAASGLGKQLALQLLEQGCLIYAADLSLQSLEKAFENATNKSNLKLLKIDVTKQADINEAVNAVKADGKVLLIIAILMLTEQATF